MRLAVVGPTAVGKTALAVEMAHRLGGELISADSRQVLRGLPVGTSTPTPAQLGGVRCHLVGVRDPGETHTVADWVVAARAAVDAIEARGAVPIIVGGTGLYVSSLLDGFSLQGGAADPTARRRRTEQAAAPGGLDVLVAELRARDPVAQVDARNPRRVIRALEVLDAGAPALAVARRRPDARPAQLIGLDAAGDVHRRLVRERAAAMVHGGALQRETAAALDRGVSRATLADCGIGYQEALALLDGSMTEAGAVDAITARTLRYARAQRTWFRRDRRIHWLTRERATDADLPGLVAGALALVAAAPV